MPDDRWSRDPESKVVLEFYSAVTKLLLAALKVFSKYCKVLLELFFSRIRRDSLLKLESLMTPTQQFLLELFLEL